MSDCDSTYESLQVESVCPNMYLRRQGTLVIEIYKTLNKLNPGYVNDIFQLRNSVRLTCEKYKLNLEIPKPNQATLRTRNVRSLGRNI